MLLTKQKTITNAVSNNSIESHSWRNAVDGASFFAPHRCVCAVSNPGACRTQKCDVAKTSHFSSDTLTHTRTHKKSQRACVLSVFFVSNNKHFK